VSDSLVIRGAREHNLRNVDLDLPRDKLIVFTGLSGSGKSSLAFDTIYAEGQRRYVESLSSYARQFLGQMDKPDVDFIEGLSPAISIDQKSASRNPRSTVGTITEVYDYLRLLYSPASAFPTAQRRGGHLPPDAPADRRPRAGPARGHPIPGPGAGRSGPQGQLRDPAGRPGSRAIARVRIDGEVHELPAEVELARYEVHHIEVVIDRLVRARRHRASPHRLVGDCAGAGRWRGRDRAGTADDGDGPGERLTFSQHLACPVDGVSYDEPAPRNFSFNSPYGACPRCDGLGTQFEVDVDLVVPDPT
jgi:excinuclease ABC subunit A